MPRPRSGQAPGLSPYHACILGSLEMTRVDRARTLAVAPSRSLDWSLSSRSLDRTRPSLSRLHPGLARSDPGQPGPDARSRSESPAGSVALASRSGSCSLAWRPVARREGRAEAEGFKSGSKDSEGRSIHPAGAGCRAEAGFRDHESAGADFWYTVRGKRD